MGFACCDGLVGGVDALVEVVTFALEAVFVGAMFRRVSCVAAAGSMQRCGEIGQKQDGQIRQQVVADCAVQCKDAVAAEFAAGALVGFGRVGVAVAEDDGAGGERGLNDLGDGLGAVGEHEGELSQRCDAAERCFGFRVQKNGADAVAESGAAWVAQGDDGAALRGQGFGEAPELGGLAGAIEALEGDKKAARHRVEFSSGLSHSSRETKAR
jgi:hypothetical protein